MTTPSQDFEASEVTEDVVQLSSLCGPGCENMDIHPNAVIGEHSTQEYYVSLFSNK